MPIVFLFSAIVSGIALVLLIYMVTHPGARQADRHALPRQAGAFLFYALIVDFSLEILDFIHRLYESEESIHILSQLISSRLFLSLIVLQVLLGTWCPWCSWLVSRRSAPQGVLSAARRNCGG